MNRFFGWGFAAAILCGTCVFTSCDDKEKELSQDEQLTQKILGKWIPVESNGIEVVTDQKTVTTFKLTGSGLKAFTSVSTFVMPTIPSGQQTQDDEEYKPDEWKYNQPADVKVEDGKVILSRAINDTINYISKIYILENYGSTMELYISTLMEINGQQTLSAMGHTEVWSKMEVDYSNDILSLWEGRITSDESKFDDGEPHRWRYNEDGTYDYYSLDGDSNWYKVNSVFNTYFVDGNLLCTRWKNVGENEVENREWWEIESIDADSMKWTAKRREYQMVQGLGGTPIMVPREYIATFSMARIPEKK